MEKDQMEALLLVYAEQDAAEKARHKAELAEEEFQSKMRRKVRRRIMMIPEVEWGFFHV